ncbi:hypothetical protein BO82DRAFT_398832 [Aspergillus uvarum CBS 121591]|uniref:Rhodopsin domain-containing protein n=1 Tax=Aspergillus uvarum CBS 121591 TaxID=1448315 RepID=A0A319CLR3_9EURO|nr:hypothetical protein BO82DRAFT_398832 [Aspergillus uvarum CBS 121591]PYH85409.1 hypothetical protein BO82DRAFT_398832 [Aspergillus uvarum CBS 121591]
MVILSVAVVIIIVAVVRVAVVARRNQNSDISWLWMWSFIEATVANIVACMASFRQLFMKQDQQSRYREAEKRVPKRVRFKPEKLQASFFSGTRGSLPPANPNHSTGERFHDLTDFRNSPAAILDVAARMQVGIECDIVIYDQDWPFGAKAARMPGAVS